MKKVISIYQAQGIETCMNCGKAITWVARLQADDKKITHVGVDCAQTLTGMKGKLKTPKAEKNNVSTFINWYKKYCVNVVKDGKFLRFQSQRDLDKKSVYNDLCDAYFVKNDEWVRLYCPDVYEEIITRAN